MCSCFFQHQQIISPQVYILMSFQIVDVYTKKKETAGMGCTICVGFYCSLFSGLIRNISIYNMARPSKYSQNNVKVLKLWVKQKTISVHLEGLGRCIHGKVRPCFPYQISSAMAGDDFICNNQH